MCFYRVLLLILLSLFTTAAQCEVAEPAPRAEDEFDLMNILAKQGLHDLEDERWNFYGQVTYMHQWKSAFRALYTNLNGSPNSLLPGAETSFTGTISLYFGLKVWDGGEIYAVPEVISMLPLSDLKGLGSAIQNFELQKNGSEKPIIYKSRAFFKQTFGLGGEKVRVASDPMQLGTMIDSRRIDLTVGNFSVLDFFDKNTFSGDLRRQFFNMAFLTYAAYDFAADARGYTVGVAGDFVYDDWAARYARVVVPMHPNQLELNYDIFQYYGDQIELEHKHELYDQPGVIRILGYRNRANMGKFSDAIAAFEANPAENAAACTSFNYGSHNATAPDLCWVRRPNIKMGIGVNFEQQLTDDIGVFFRGMYSDGKTEVYSYTSTDRSISLGGLMKGYRWNRNSDMLGIGYGQGWISKEHAAYLGMGGIDGFIGDGRINQVTERVVDIFYSFNVLNPIWITADYQHIDHPAYNADRGPVNIYGARVHIEF